MVLDVFWRVFSFFSFFWLTRVDGGSFFCCCCFVVCSKKREFAPLCCGRDKAQKINKNNDSGTKKMKRK